MKPSIFSRIEDLLNNAGATFDVSRHEPVYTSEEASRVRGVDLSSGAKALVCKAAGEYRMFVMPANLKLDSRQVRRGLGCRRLRFADRQEVLELTGLTPGSIPPFGSLFDVPTLCDERLGENEWINFNAGDHRITVSMRFADYIELEKPQLGIWGK